MYAVVATGGKQYRVEAGTTLLVERLMVEAGATVTFDRVLLVGDGEDVTIGTPLVSGATVSATVLAEERGPKLVIFKFRQKVKYRRRRGHRQQLTRVRIDAINGAGAPAESEMTEKPARRAPARTRARKTEAEGEPTAVQEAVPPKPARRRAKPAADAASAEPVKKPRRTSAAKKAAEEQ